MKQETEQEIADRVAHARVQASNKYYPPHALPEKPHYRIHVRWVDGDSTLVWHHDGHQFFELSSLLRWLKPTSSSKG